MVLVITNAILYLILLIVYWYKKKDFDAGTLLLTMWFVVAVTGVIYYCESPTSWQLQLWPFLYIYFCFILLSRYIFTYRYSEKSITRLAYSKNRIIDVFCWIYLVCVVIKLVNQGLNFSALSLIQVAEDTAEAYENHLTYEFQGGIIAYIATVYEQYFKIVCVIWGFNCLCQKRRLPSILFFSFPFISSFGDGIFMGSRNTIVMAVMLYVCAYVLYRKIIPSKTKKIIFISSLLIGTIVVLYLLAITESRFGVDTQAAKDNGIVSYLGQSMLQFNYGVADTDHRIFGGALNFKNTYNLLGIQLPPTFRTDYLGTHVGTGFITLVGFLVIDFGYLGTIIFCLLFPLLMKGVCLRNKGFNLPILYIFLFYLTRMLRGAMVYSGSGADLSYFAVFVFALLLELAMSFDSLISVNKKENKNKYLLYTNG